MGAIQMHVLLYVPDNQVTNNFIPHLWPFLLQRLTPDEHRVSIIDGNAQAYNSSQLVEFIRRAKIELVGMGFMTRMAQSAYRMASAIRAATGVPVVMGGPHVTEVPEEPLGLTGLPRCADAVVRGEADDLWTAILQDAARGTPLYERLRSEGRLVRPQHWLDFKAFKPAFMPKQMTAEQVESELHQAWSNCYNRAAFKRAQKWLLQNEKPFESQLTHFLARMFFRGIYFPQMSGWSWIKMLLGNLDTMSSLMLSRWWRQRAFSGGKN